MSWVVGDDVTPGSERMRQILELGAWHEHVDVDRCAQPAVIADRDAADHGMIGSDLRQDRRELPEGLGAFLESLQRMNRDSERNHESG
jgi:hypothetical protein